MESERSQNAAAERKVSRRWVLRHTVGVTAGVAAIGSMNVSLDAQPVQGVGALDHDPSTGHIVDRDRHHHWDTV